MNSEELCQVYRCLCDLTRLRILNLLKSGPLCVCHLQDILNEPQVKVSKHLSYLKTYQLVDSERRGNWMIYRLADTPNAILAENLSCLQDLRLEDPIFKRDSSRLSELDPKVAPSKSCC